MSAKFKETSIQIDEIKRALQSGNFEQGILLSQQLLDEHHDQTEALYFLAVAQRAKGLIEEANKTINRLLSIAPEHSRAHQEQGYIRLNNKDKKGAATAFANATRINPALLSSWQKLIDLYAQLGHLEASEFATQQVAELKKLPAEIRGAKDLMFEGKLKLADTVCRRYLQTNKHHLLAEIGIRLKHYHQAEFLLESCVEIHPEHAPARAEYIQLLAKIGKFSKAKQHAEFLLEKFPNNHQYLAAKATALVGIGDIEQAIPLYQKILTERSNLPGIQLLLGHAYKAQGQFAQAVEAYQAAYHIRADFGDAYWSLANTKTYQFTEHELTSMHNHLNQASTEQDDKVHLAFALAKAKEDQHNFDQAFNYYQIGNKLRNQQCHYSPAKLDEQIQQQKSVFNAEYFSQYQQLGDQSPEPIFIVGLPRAGSTLLEQILASHSQVDGTMELHNILGLAARLSDSKSGYPAIMNELQPEYFSRFGQQFIQDTQCYRQGAAFFIDKMPNNFMHIGLIKSILPNAKIIDARRDRMACCFSGYKQLFAEGQEFSYDLDNLVHYYQSYLSLMEHWETVLPGFVLKVQHEDLIDDLETQVRRMLDFCGLPFEPACLQFYKTKRSIKTPSSEQVRQPINSAAREQWKNFESHLVPLIDAFSSQ